MSNIYLNRGEASQVLKVSTRTLDRYLRKFKVKIRKKGRAVLIPKGGVDRIINNHVGKFLADFGQAVQHVHKEANLAVKDIRVEKIKTQEEGVFKHLYFEVKKDLKEKQDRLEAATYRVGQLEAQVKNMVPLLDYSRKDRELKEAHLVLENRMVQNQETIGRMQNLLRNERVAKWVYLSLTGLLLIAEPVLFLFWAFS